MRVLTIVYDLGPGGTQRAAQNFSTAFRRAGCDVAVLALHGSGPRAVELDAQRIPVFVGGPDPEAALTASRDWRPDVIHIHRWGGPDAGTAAVLKRLKTGRCKVIETNVFSWVDPSEDRKLIDLHLHLSRWCLWKWGRSVRDLRVKPEPAGCVVPYLVDAPRFSRSTDAEIREFRKEHGIPEKAFVFGRIGQPHSGKWSAKLFPAIHEVGEAERDAYFLLVGLPDALRPGLDSIPGPVRSRVKLIPLLQGDEELRRCYSAMDVFVHAAAIGESFGMVLAEAMLCGVPVVTLSTPRADNSQLEMVGHGEGGLVVSRPGLLGPALLRMKRDQAFRERLSDNAPRLIRSRFDGPVVIRNLLRIIEAIPPAGGPGAVKAAVRRLDGVVTDVGDGEIRQLLRSAAGIPPLRDLLFVNHPRFYGWLRSVRNRMILN